MRSGESGSSISGPNTHEILQAAVKWHKWLTGKGPANATISTSHSMVEVTLQGVLTRLEEMACQTTQGQQRVKVLRLLTMETYKENLARELQNSLPWEEHVLLFEINVERDALYIWCSAGK